MADMLSDTLVCRRTVVQFGPDHTPHILMLERIPGPEIYLTRDECERLHEYLNREFPTRTPELAAPLDTPTPNPVP